MRKTVVVLHDTKRKAIHFTDTKLKGDDVWLPFDSGSVDLFRAVEDLLVLNRIAHNVTRVECVRQCGVCEDFNVVYNAA